jgi:hypothetical protein
MFSDPAAQVKVVAIDLQQTATVHLHPVHMAVHHPPTGDQGQCGSHMALHAVLPLQDTAVKPVVGVFCREVSDISGHSK